MGWKGHEFIMPVGMLFRKMYCHQCGERLTKKKVSVVLQKGDPFFTSWLSGRATIGMDRKEEISYIYKCQNCGLEINYDAQCEIAKKQKELNKKILDEKE